MRDLGGGPQASWHEIGTQDRGDQKRNQHGCERRHGGPKIAPARNAAAHLAEFYDLGGSARLCTGQPLADPLEQLRRRLDRLDARMQLIEPVLPAAHQRGETRVGANKRLRLRALGGIERAEHIFGGEHVAIVVAGHEPRHSRTARMLRRSQVLMVLTGRPKRAASCSRDRPS